jgi:hypothetical protein
MQQEASGGGPAQSVDRTSGDQATVSDLVSLLEHIGASIKRGEAAIASETPPGDQEAADDLVVLDHIAPRYAKAGAALHACHAGRGAALHFLLDAATSVSEISASHLRRP